MPADRLARRVLAEVADRSKRATAEAKLTELEHMEIAAVGIDWHASTGDITIQQSHLHDAILASQDPTLESARIKIGHDDPTPWNPGGEPAFGKLVDFKLNDNGMKLLAKPVDVPVWLAEIMPSAYPNRSMEAYFEFSSNAGKFYSLYIDGLALLGVVAPAIGSLEELSTAGYYGDTMPEGVKVTTDRKQVFFSGRIQADVGQVDVLRAFYSALDAGELPLPEDVKLGYWTFVCEFFVSPARIIAQDDDTGDLWSFGYSVEGSEVKFSTGEKVQVQYVAAMRGVKAASFRNAKEARASYPKEENSVDIAALRAQLGDDATNLSDDEVIAEAVKRLAASSEEPAPEPAPTPDPPEPDPTSNPAPTASTVTVEAGVFQSMQSDLQRLTKRDTERINAERDSEVDGWVRAGRISPFSRKVFRQQLEVDPEGTRKQVAQFAVGTIPVDKEKGSAGADEFESGNAYPTSFLTPQERARLEAAQAGTAGARRHSVVNLRD